MENSETGAMTSQEHVQPRYYFANEFKDFRKIFWEYPHKVVYASPGEDLKAMGKLLDGNHFIAEGVLEVVVEHDSGLSKLIGTWGENSIYPIIVSNERFGLESSISVRAATGTRTWFYPVETMRKIMMEHPEVALAAIDHYCRYTNALKFWSTSQTYEDLRTRICNVLYLGYLHRSENPQPMNQSELASLVGSRRESVVKVLAKLRAEGIVASRNSGGGGNNQHRRSGCPQEGLFHAA